MGYQNCQVLEGGFAKWVAEERPVEATDENSNEEEAFAY